MIDFNDPSKKYESAVLSPGWGGHWFQQSRLLNWDNLHVLGISSIDEPKRPNSISPISTTLLEMFINLGMHLAVEMA